MDTDFYTTPTHGLGLDSVSKEKTAEASVEMLRLSLKPDVFLEEPPSAQMEKMVEYVTKDKSNIAIKTSQLSHYTEEVTSIVKLRFATA